MGRMPLESDKLELLTSDLNCKVMVGEKVSRYLLEKELSVEGAPLRREGRPLPLCNLAAWVALLEVKIAGRDRVKVRGQLEGKGLFAGESGTREVPFEQEEFRQEFSVPGARPGMEVNGHSRISFLAEGGPPQEAEGRVFYQVKIEVETFITVVDYQQAEVAVGAKNISAERLERQVVVFEELLEERPIPLTLEGELEFPGELDYLKITSNYLADFEWEQNKEKIRIQGTVVTWYYFSTATRSGFMENRQFFREDISLDRLEKGAELSVLPAVEYVDFELQGERVSQRAYVDLLVRVTRNVQQEVLLAIEDLDTYSEYLLLPRAVGVTGEKMEIVKRIDLPYPQELAAGPSRLRDLKVQVEEDGVSINGILEFYLYYVPAEEQLAMEPDLGDEDSRETAEQKNLPLMQKVEELFQHQLHLPGVRAGDEAFVYTRSGKCEFAPAEAATLGVNHGVLEVKVRQVEEYAVVVPSRVPPGTSMVIYAVKKGDNLLKIARSYGVNAAAVAESNGLTEDDDLQVGQKLLIPLMLYKR